jgi:hypothetical protein
LSHEPHDARVPANSKGVIMKANHGVTRPILVTMALAAMGIGCSGGSDGNIGGGGGSAAGTGGFATGAGGTSGNGTGGTGTGGSSGTGIGGTSGPGTGGTGGTGSGMGGAGGGGRDGGGATGGNGNGGASGRDAGPAGDTGTISTADPVIPPISGTCPTFATGTITLGGLGGIALQVGPISNGTGSLLFYWHGTGSTSGEVNALVPAAVRQELLLQGGIIVSFQGSLGTGGDCSGTATFSKDDFTIADTIASCAVRDYGIDPRRIYTTGCSAGGLQAGCMGALRSSYIAATVPNSGGELAQQPIQDRSRVPAVMTMHGGAQDMVIVSFATTSATYDAQMKAAGSFVVNCNHGGGHCQAPAALYTAGWEFMKAHPFGIEPEPFASGLPASFPDFCTVE